MNLSPEEIKEKDRHDRFYRKFKYKIDDLWLAPFHHEKFDNITEPLHCYTYAMKNLGEVSGKNILDIGCGKGEVSVILAKRGARVYGIDISPEAIKIAKDRAIANRVSTMTDFQVMSFYNIKFPYEYFDKIIGKAVLHHCNHKKMLSNTLFRLLKFNGRVVFIEPFGNSRYLEKIRLLVPVKVQEEDKTHWNEQIKYSDLTYFEDLFEIHYKEMHFISRFDRVIQSESLVNWMGIIDLKLLKIFPWLKPYARDIAIILDKKIKS